MMQYIFVSRKSKTDIKEVQLRMKERLNMIDKDPSMTLLGIFPEGTVSNGTTI